MKRIMIIAGGQWQISLVKKAKEMGLFVINTNLYPNSPAFSYADVCEVADVLDKEKHIEIAKKYHPDAVVTDQSDIAVPTVTAVAEALNIRGIGVSLANLFTNKFLMREYGKAHGFPTPAFRLCSTLEEAHSFWREVGDIIIKPPDSQASRGVYRVQSQEQLENLFPLSLKCSNRAKAVLAEQFISGTEFTVDGICCEKEHHSLAISKKEHYQAYPNVASSLYFSHMDPNYVRLGNQNNALIDSTRLPFGLTHAEYIYHNGEFYLVEVAARGGGSNISSKIVPLMSGIDTNKAYIQMSLGQHVTWESLVKEEVPKTRCCILEFFDFLPGKVTGLKGVSELNKIENLVDYHLGFKAGDRLPPPETDAMRPGHFIAYSHNGRDLDAIRKRIKDAVKIEYEPDTKTQSATM